MTSSLLDRLELGNARAVANAKQVALRREEEERIVADLVASLARHDGWQAPCGLGGADGTPASAA